MIVAKFGGGLLNSSEGLLRVCDEIRRLSEPLLVVVSAFANVTNLLEHLADHALADSAAAARDLDAIIELHAEIARRALSPAAHSAWLKTIAPHRGRLADVVQGLGIVRELSPRTLDLIVHFGERFSSALLLAALNDGPSTVDAAGISALDLIITDGAHRYARPDLELTRERVLEQIPPLLAAHPVVVTEGYIARSASGQATTMGRESSNYSATMLGSILAAREVRIYTGVPGILTADPKLIPEARTLRTMSYAMANTLAELGAKILHPRTVMPVERSSIPLVITSLGGESTTIGTEGERGYSIALLPDAELIWLETATTTAALDPFLRAIAAETPIIWQQRFRHRMQILLAGSYPHAALPVHLVAEPVEAHAAPVSVVSLVGEGRLSGEEMERFFAAFAGRDLLAMQGGIEGRAISVALDRDAALGTLASLHDRFAAATGVLHSDTHT
ncbi:MAG: aspartate kinase [Bacteroidota bacterium]